MKAEAMDRRERLLHMCPCDGQRQEQGNQYVAVVPPTRSRSIGTFPMELTAGLIDVEQI